MEKTKSALEVHAIDELTRIGMYDSDGEMNKCICEHILKMIKVFAEEGHTGFSANYVIECLQKLLQFEPLSPLTGEEDEWSEPINGILQNKRAYRVFKNINDGRAFDVRGRVFVGQEGQTYISGDSRVYIEFPYTPKTEYVNVEEEQKTK